MKHLLYKRIICLVLVMLLAAAVLTLTGCQSTEAGNTSSTTADGKTVLGEGDKLFYFNVTFSDGKTSSYAIHTDDATVGEALVELQLIAGEDSDYGLYVKTVDGETLDYATDGMYWAFYENDEYAMTGVDSTQITDGASYAFIATPG